METLSSGGTSAASKLSRVSFRSSFRLKVGRMTSNRMLSLPAEGNLIRRSEKFLVLYSGVPLISSAIKKSNCSRHNANNPLYASQFPALKVSVGEPHSTCSFPVFSRHQVHLAAV